LPFVLVLVVLGALWAVVLVPPLLRSRTERTSDSIGDFNYRLDVLGRTNGTAPRSTSMPTSRVSLPFSSAPLSRAAKRRRDIFTMLFGAVITTMALVYVTGLRAFWVLQVLADIALVSYLVLWASFRSMQAERVAKVRMLPQQRTPEFALRRTGSS
jgi:hypothetical protein